MSILAAVARVEMVPSFAGFGARAVTGLRGAGTGLEAESRAIGTRMGRAMSLGMGTLVGVTGIAVGLVEAVKKASDFQGEMERVHTQAGASADEVGRMSKALLGMADTGQSAQSLAEGLYHIESAGFRGQTALDALREAAKGATIGHAGLEDVSQAMIATLASGIPGVHGATDAMAILNKTVGIGDMRMSQLAQAMATGVLPSARSAGLSMNDVSAALATITDNATPANESATRLRMTFALMSAPTEAAKKSLATIGLSGSQLAADMRKPNGLMVAITDLKTHLEASGLSAAQQNAVIVRAFGGGRSSGAIMTLITQSDRLRQKYDELGNSTSRAKDYQDAWAKTQETFPYKMQAFRASVHNLFVTVGSDLLPVLGRFADYLTKTVVPAIETKLLPAVGRFVKNEGPTFKVLWHDTAAAVKEAAGWIGTAWDTIKRFMPEDQRKRILELLLALVALKKLGVINLGFTVAKGLLAAAGVGGAGAAGTGGLTLGALAIPAVAGLVAGEATNVAVDKYGPRTVDGRRVTSTGKAWEKVGAGAAAGAGIGAAIGSVVPVLGTGIGAAVGGVAGATAGFLSNPKAIISSTESGAKGAFRALMDHFVRPVTHWFENDAPKLWHKIADPVVKVFGEVKHTVTKAFDDVKHTITSGFDAWWKTHGKALQDVWHAVWGGISKAFHFFWDPIVWAFKSKELQRAVRDLMSGVLDVFKVAWDLIKGVFKVGWDIIKAGFKVLWDVVKPAVKEAWDAIVYIFSLALDLLTGHWHTAWTDTVNFLKQTWNNIKDLLVNGLTDLVNGLGSIAIDVGKSVYGALKDAANVFISALNVLLDTIDAGLKLVHLPEIPHIPALEQGGRVVAGRPYIVGERRPELFVPDSNGTILPHVPTAQRNGLGGGDINVTVYNPVPETASESVPAALRRLTYQMGG